MSLFYTIMPPEELFEGWEEYEPALVEVQAGQAVLLVLVDRPLKTEGTAMTGGVSGGVIERVISADPSVYLAPGLAPGNSIQFSVGPDGKGTLINTAPAP